VIFFDWQNQSDSVIQGLRLSDERTRTLVMMVDASHNVIASSDPQSPLGHRDELHARPGQATGYSTLPKNSIKRKTITP
ncbi:chemotaxis protein, partial [Pseudomonas syringae pv. tagetis]